MIDFRIRALAGLAIVAACAGCAGAPAKSKAEPAAVAVTGKEILFLANPVLADSVDTLLSGLGWGGGRFAGELKKEIAYQFNRRGVAISEDTAKAKASLILTLSQYERNGSSTRFSLEALLNTPAGQRKIAIQKAPKGAEAPERDDPTVDNIRTMATALVEEAGKDPNAVTARKRKQKTGPEYNPGLLLVF